MAQNPSKQIGGAIYSAVTEYLDAYNKYQVLSGSPNADAIMAAQAELVGDASISVIQDYSNLCNNTLQQDNVQIAALQAKMDAAGGTIISYFAEDQARTSITNGDFVISVIGGNIVVASVPQ